MASSPSAPRGPPAAALLFAAVAATRASPAQGEPWVPDRGDGTGVNPLLFADYCDPDVVRMGGDF